MRTGNRSAAALLATIAGSIVAGGASADVAPDAGMIRMPDVSG